MQEDVRRTACGPPRCSLRENPNSAFITVRVYANLTKMWDPDALAVFAKDATMGVVDVGPDHRRRAGRGGGGGGGGASGGAESRGKSGSGAKSSRAVDSLRKKQFAMGTLIGEVKISVKDLVVGAEPEPRWLPILPAARDPGLFGGAPPRWLASRGDALGELCVALGSGYLRQAPDDLINPGDHQIRPQLGTLEVQLVSAEGTSAPSTPRRATCGLVHPSSRLSRPRGDSPVDLLGSRVSAQLLFEGRAEKVASTFEHRAFEVTNPRRSCASSSSARDRWRWTRCSWAPPCSPCATCSARSTARWTPGSRWCLPTEPPPRLRCKTANSECARRRAARGWRGRVRVRAKLTKLAPAHRWYLANPRARGRPARRRHHPRRGQSAERVVTAFLAPITRSSRRWRIVRAARIRASTARGSRGTPRYVSSRGDTWGAFFPLWVVSGWVFVGYTCARAREMDEPAPMYHGRRVLRALHARDDAPLAPSASMEKATNARRKKGREEEEREYDAVEEEEERVAIAELLRSKEKAKAKEAKEAKAKAKEAKTATAAKEATASKDGCGGAAASSTTDPSSCSDLSDMRVAGFEHESRSELCRLRVQCWLREIRVRRKRVLLELEREEREAALRASGKSPKSTIRLLRKAQGGDRRRARASAASASADEDVDDTDPMQVLLRWLRLRKIARILSAANPAEIIMRVLQQIIWQLLVILKSTGSTLVNVTVPSGACTRCSRVPAAKRARVGPPGGYPRAARGRAQLSRRGALRARLRRPPGLTLALCSPCDSRSSLCGACSTRTPPCARGTSRGSSACFRARARARQNRLRENRRRRRAMLQNLLGSVHVAPICLHSIEALERALEEEFAAAGGRGRGWRR